MFEFPEKENNRKRAANNEVYDLEADLRNSDRSTFKKVFGIEKEDSLSIAHEDAFKINQTVDRFAQEGDYEERQALDFAQSHQKHSPDKREISKAILEKVFSADVITDPVTLSMIAEKYSITDNMSVIDFYEQENIKAPFIEALRKKLSDYMDMLDPDFEAASKLADKKLDAYLKYDVISEETRDSLMLEIKRDHKEHFDFMEAVSPGNRKLGRRDKHLLEIFKPDISEDPDLL